MPALLLLVLLASVPQDGASSLPTTKSLDGLWLSEGYGLLLEIEGDSLQVYEITNISCLPSWKAARHPGALGDLEAVFASNGRTIRFRNHAATDPQRARIDGTASDILLRRLDERPTSCSRSKENTPQNNYAIFWETFREHYPFFVLHRTDWSAIDEKFRPQVGLSTTPEELFGIFRQMIAPLADSHTGIEAPDRKAFFDGSRSDPHHLEERDWMKAIEIIDSKYLQGGLRSYCNGRLQYGILDSSTGYLRVTAFYGYADTKGYANALAALQSALDTIFKDTSKLRSLVVDLRLNKGGDDSLGIELASRLTRKKYLAYRKRARNDQGAGLNFTLPQDVWIEPSASPSFHGTVVILTGPDTVSAGETFTMALMGREPRVMRIGLNTQGVFSDVMNRLLPNGWSFRLPNEVYLTKEGESFDVAGVPPDVRVPFFRPRDLRKGRDSALEKALKVLSHSR